MNRLLVAVGMCAAMWCAGCAPSRAQLKEIRNNTTTCVVTATTGFNKAEVIGHKARGGWLRTELAKGSGNSIRTGWMSVEIATFKNNRLVYGWLFSSTSEPIRNGRVRIRRGLFEEVYVYSKACSPFDAAIGAAGLMYLKDQSS